MTTLSTGSQPALSLDRLNTPNTWNAITSNSATSITYPLNDSAGRSLVAVKAMILFSATFCLHKYDIILI